MIILEIAICWLYRWILATTANAKNKHAGHFPAKGIRVWGETRQAESDKRRRKMVVSAINYSESGLEGMRIKTSTHGQLDRPWWIATQNSTDLAFHYRALTVRSSARTWVAGDLTFASVRKLKYGHLASGGNKGTESSTSRRYKILRFIWILMWLGTELKQCFLFSRNLYEIVLFNNNRTTTEGRIDVGKH